MIEVGKFLTAFRIYNRYRWHVRRAEYHAARLMEHNEQIDLLGDQMEGLSGIEGERRGDQ